MTVPVNIASAGTVAENATLSLKNLLVTADGDTPAVALIYTVKALPDEGTLMLGGAAIAVGGTFTQQDVNDGKVSYVHGGAEAPSDGFIWDLSDSRGSLSGMRFVITITPVNDAPVVVLNPLSSVAEGATLVLDNSKLMVMDVDSSTLTYTLVSTPTRGRLEKRPSPTGAFAALDANGTFTQQDIANGNVRFVDSGVDDAKLQLQQDTSMQFSWRVADGDGGFNPSSSGANVTTFTVTSVDDPPVISWRANGCHHANQADPADPVISISDADNPVSAYSICVVSIGAAVGTFMTQNGGVTSGTVIPTLKNGSTPITAPSCVPVNARNGLTLTSEIIEEGGSVTWVLRRDDGKDFPPQQSMSLVTTRPPCP